LNSKLAPIADYEPMTNIRTMTIEDYVAVTELLTSTSGVRLRDADSGVATARYLARNPGLSFVAVVDEAIVGCVMCGHDGRRGYLQHLAVSPNYRRRGIGSALVDECLTHLATLGIVKCESKISRHISFGDGAAGISVMTFLDFRL
jgi:ribosomal protein S18 acetylase RimI-like enzyme